MGIATAEAIAQAQAKSSEIFERIGYKHIYERLEEFHSLKQPDLSLHESVRVAPFELAALKISQQNAYN